jgi:uncharacterized protein YjbI with pentapeptide repeats
MNDTADEPSKPSSAEPEFRKISEEKLQRILADHKKWVEAKDKTGLDHLRANLSLADLRGHDAILSGARLQGAVLDLARLEGVDLIGARLQAAELFGTRLQGAKLSEAQLQGLGSGELNCRGPVFTRHSSTEQFLQMRSWRVLASPMQISATQT